MKIFLSYPSDERTVAERLQYSLLAQGHDVFFDRADLTPGREYDQAIAEAVDASDLFVFLITPASVTSGRYTLTELGLAQRKWPHPNGRVLPVMLRATPIDAVPAYLRAVNILTPSGDAVAESALETQRLARSLPLTIQATRRLRSRGGVVATIVAIGVVGTATWLVRDRGGSSGDTTGAAARAPVVTPLAEDVRHRARAVAPAADGGFIVATVSPNQVVHFSADGARVGATVALVGEPVFAARTAAHTMVVTRAPDGVTVLDWRDQRIADTVRLDASRLKTSKEVGAAKPSSDIQSVAVGTRGALWVTTGERDGEPAVLRFLQDEHRWEVPTWALRPEGLVGEDARGLLLRLVGRDLWAVTARTSPSSLHHLVDFTRIDEFGGHDLQMVSCAHDLAESSAGNLLFLSCDNELLEVSVEAKTLTLVSTRPTLPSESGPGNWTDEILVRDSAVVVVALNTEVSQPSNRPGHARIAQVDSAGVVTTLLDVRDAVVRSMAVMPTVIVAVLRRADGTTDAMRIARPARAH